MTPRGFFSNTKTIRASSQRPNGFTLATLLVISTTMMIMGAAVLQGTLSVKNALNDQYYDELAREAAEAGLKYAEACVAQDATWSQLRPNTNCTGGSNGTAPLYVVETDTYRSTFTVNPLDVRSDTSTLATAVGKVELLRRESSAVYRSYNETLGRAVGATSMSVMPTSMETGGSASSDTTAYLAGYNGTIYGMGTNSGGALGDGTTTLRSSPVPFQLPAGLFAKKISTGSTYVSVLASDGQVYSAGTNTNGQLGDGTTTSRSTPVKFPLPAGIFATDVITGGGGAGRNTFVLTSNGRVYGTGSNAHGQLTGTNTADQLTPKLLPLPAGMTRVKKISFPRNTNDTLSLIILGTNGTVWGVGINDDMQLGTSDRTDKTSFIQLAIPGGIRASDIKTGYHATFIHAVNAQVYGYGQGSTGQLGNASTTQWQSVGQLFDLPGTLTVQKVFPASSSSVAETGNNEESSTFVIASDHNVYGAGQNHNGQLGDTTTTNRSTPVEFQLPGNLTAVDMDAKYFTTCVMASDKQVYCAGRNEFGQLGIGNTTNQSTPQKFPLPSGLFAVDVVVGFGEVYVSASNGVIYSAGRNTGGQLGIGNTTNQLTPVAVKMPVVPLTRTPVMASMSYAGSHVLASDGQVYGVGHNADGELGAGVTTDPQSIALKFQLPVGYAREVKGGFFDTYVLASDGQLYGAGRNQNNQLGIGDTSDQTTPIKFPIGNTFATRWVRNFWVSTSSTSNDTTLVHASDNQLYGTGPNTQGQLGNGTTTPVTDVSTTGKFSIPALTVMKAFFGDGGANNATFVLASNEKLYVAGNNNRGQLGIGSTTTPITTPVASSFPTGCYIDDVDIGTFYTYALCRNGDVYAMGANSEGQLGIGNTTTPITTPTKMVLPAGLTGQKILMPRGGILGTGVPGFGWVLASDGQVYGTGGNAFGQLGDGTTTAKSTPVKVQLPAGISAVDAWPGNGAVYILGSDGNMYVTGRNDYGQLGVGDTTNRTTATTKIILPAGVLAVEPYIQYALNSMTTMGTPDYFMGVLGSDGKLYMAGNNARSQLGDHTTTQRTTPVQFLLPQPASKPSIIF